MNQFCRSFGCLILFVISALADWRDDASYPALQAEMGAGLPTGTGIPVLQSEATVTAPPTYTFLPQATTGSVPFAGTGAFAGKTFTPHSGPSGTSGHAAVVANWFYGNTTSLAPGVTDVHAWLADDFATQLYNNSPPPVFAGSVQNHSWAGTFGSDAVDTEVTRRLDLLVARDGTTISVPLNNGAGMQKLLANAFHAITAGLVNGNHPHTGTNLDVVGRMKPDLVVNQSYTSEAAPSVASAAAMLLQAVRASYPTADDPRVIKAILIAAASKQRFPAWQRTTAANPYDVNFGAGELNVLNAWHILAADRQMPSESLERSVRGWDLGASDATTPVRYFFRIPEGRWAETLSVSTTWHRQFSSGVSVATLANLNLRVARAAGFTPGTTVDQSVSAIDNVEHVFLRNLPAGQYVIEVSADATGEPFAVAWEAQLGSGPQVTAQHGATNNTLSLSKLDPLKAYTIQSSPDLSTWSDAGTLRTADTTASFTATWQDATAAASFYRLKWTP